MFLIKLSQRFVNTRMHYNNLGLWGIIRHYSEEQQKMPSISPLPFGDVLPSSASLQEFKDQEWIFVDKTDIIHQLINNESSFILTRPRRFGKSLLLDTIDMIFKKDKIIKHLKIGKHYKDLKPHPVIRFDFLLILI